MTKAITWLQLSALPEGTRVVCQAGHLKLTDDTPIVAGTTMLIVMQGLNELTAELWLRPYHEDLLAKLQNDEEVLRFYIPDHAPNGWASVSSFTLADDEGLDFETLKAWRARFNPTKPVVVPEEIDAVDIPQAPPAFYSVAIYLVDKAYGGPEEGGWYYDYGIRQDVNLSTEFPELKEFGVPAIFPNEERAIAWMENANHWLDQTANKGRREISSVLSTGRYRAEVHENYPPHHWPETRPHYE